MKMSQVSFITSQYPSLLCPVFAKSFKNKRKVIFCNLSYCYTARSSYHVSFQVNFFNVLGTFKCADFRRKNTIIHSLSLSLSYSLKKNPYKGNIYCNSSLLHHLSHKLKLAVGRSHPVQYTPPSSCSSSIPYIVALNNKNYKI